MHRERESRVGGSHASRAELLVQRPAGEARGVPSREARASFLRMMAHELRTPLQAIKMLVEAMRRGAAVGEPCTPEMFDRLEAQFDRFSRLAGDLTETLAAPAP